MHFGNNKYQHYSGGVIQLECSFNYIIAYFSELFLEKNTHERAKYTNAWVLLFI